MRKGKVRGDRFFLGGGEGWRVSGLLDPIPAAAYPLHSRAHMTLRTKLMERLHIAQFSYRPAYYDGAINYLDEPHEKSNLGQLRNHEPIAKELSASRAAYLEYLKSKITSILRLSAKRAATILLLPEYSIPPELLEMLYAHATQTKTLIVAGSHRVSRSPEVEQVYNSLNLRVETQDDGTAICPILFPDGSTAFVPKCTASKWEGGLKRTTRSKTVIKGRTRRGEIHLLIYLCIDALSPDQLSLVANVAPDEPTLGVCVSLSPSTNEFSSAANLFALNSTLFAYCNSALYGGSSFFIPERSKQYLRGHRYPFTELAAGTEGVLEIDANLRNVSPRSGALDGGVELSHPTSIPILTSSDNEWHSDYVAMVDLVLEAIGKNDRSSAADCIDEVLTKPDISPEVLERLRYLRHNYLPQYDGNKDDIDTLLEICWLPSEHCSLAQLSRDTIKATATSLLSMMATPGLDPKDLTHHFTFLRSVIPNEPLDRVSKGVTQLPTDPTPKFNGDKDLLRRFQNRGNFLDEMRDVFSDASAKVVFVSGPLGIGKTDSCRIIFLKQLTDWSVETLTIPKGSKPARLLSEIGRALGVRLDADALAAASHRIFQARARMVAQRFYSTSKRALIVRDLNSIFTSANAREINQLQSLAEAFANCDGPGHSKILMVSSRYLPEHWTRHPGVRSKRLLRLQDVYISRVLEQDMRSLGRVGTDGIAAPSQEVLNLIAGNPLVAKLLLQHDVDLLGRTVKGHSRPVGVATVRAVAESLLNGIQFSDKEKFALEVAAVFRLPIRVEWAKSVAPLRSLPETWLNLANKGVLSFDGDSIELHEVIRAHFLSNSPKTALAARNEWALDYYERAASKAEQDGAFAPAITAELVYHAGLSNKKIDVRRLNKAVGELKQAAKVLYKNERDYDRALKVYLTLNELIGDDLEVLSYIGRCYGRRQQWDNCREAFDDAIRIANLTGQGTAWLYRDLGHIYSRFQRYEEARQVLEIARSITPGDPSIVAAEAYMYGREGKDEVSERLFKEALSLNSNHTYTLRYYSKLLRQAGRSGEAAVFESRLRELEGGQADAFYVYGDLDDDDDDI